MSTHLNAQEQCDYSRDFFDNALILSKEKIKDVKETANSKKITLWRKEKYKITIHYQACNHISFEMKSKVNAAEFDDHLKYLKSLFLKPSILPVRVFESLKESPFDKKLNLTLSNTLFYDIRAYRIIDDNKQIMLTIKMLGAP